MTTPPEPRRFTIGMMLAMAGLFSTLLAMMRLVLMDQLGDGLLLGAVLFTSAGLLLSLVYTVVSFIIGGRLGKTIGFIVAACLMHAYILTAIIKLEF